MPEFWRDPLGFVTMCARTYGDVVAVRMGPRLAFQLNSPADIEYVLVKNHRNFIKHPALSVNRYLFGNGLLVSEGDDWLRQRRLAQPSFHRAKLADYGEIMVDLAERMLAGWRDGETRDLHAELMHMTVRVATKTLFGTDLSDDEASAVEDAQREVMAAYYARFNSLFFLLPERLPTPTNLRMKRAAQQLDRVLHQAVLPRRDPDGDDLLSMLLAVRDRETGEGLTPTQLRDEVMDLFLAGHETTAGALSWTWLLLMQHPDVEAKLRAEVGAVLGDGRATAADLPGLRYTEMVVKEAMRLYPPAWILGRQARSDCRIGGYRVPAGSLLQMSQWVVHRDRRYYDDPETFRPERWEAGRMDGLPKYAYFPFGGGPRVCIGNGFAMMEAVLVVATIAQRFRLALAPGQEVRPLPSMTLRPAAGMNVVLRQLAAASRGGRRI
jgi:cytochrome P450